MEYDLHTEHSVVIRRADDKFGFFGFPNVTCLSDGRLLVSCSGLRLHHMCPFGKVVLVYCAPDASKWGQPEVMFDSRLDDRDPSILKLGGDRIMCSWYNWPLRMYFERPFMQMLYEQMDNEDFLLCAAHLRSVTREQEERDFGSYTRISNDNGMTWEEPRKAPICSFHGPILLQNGSMLYCGKDVLKKETGGINFAYRSTDEGRTWELVSEIPIPAGDVSYLNFVDPCALQLPSGRILLHLRYQNAANPGIYGRFTVFQSISDDLGKTWTVPECLGVNGSPPHLLLHSSGAVVCVYGRREKPWGERAMVSFDEGRTWIKELVLRDDTPHPDLGFPCSTELADGSIFTVYYQRLMKDDRMDEKCSIAATRWRLDDLLAARHQ
jgi:hypothetical protein